MSPAVVNGGNGEPKAFTGLVGTSHRPSDDLSVFGTCDRIINHGSSVLMLLAAFLTSANAMLSVELTQLAMVLDEVGQLQNVSKLAKQYSSTVKDAIWKTTVRLSGSLLLPSPANHTHNYR